MPIAHIPNSEPAISSYTWTRSLATFYSTVPTVPQVVIASLAAFRTRTWSFRRKGFQEGNSALFTGNPKLREPPPCAVLTGGSADSPTGRRAGLPGSQVHQIGAAPNPDPDTHCWLCALCFVLFSYILRTLLRCFDSWTTYPNSFSTSTKGQLSIGSGLGWAAFSVDENS